MFDCTCNHRLTVLTRPATYASFDELLILISNQIYLSLIHFFMIMSAHHVCPHPSHHPSHFFTLAFQAQNIPFHKFFPPDTNAALHTDIMRNLTVFFFQIFRARRFSV